MLSFKINWKLQNNRKTKRFLNAYDKKWIYLKTKKDKNKIFIDVNYKYI